MTISILEDTFFEDSEMFEVEISLIMLMDGGCVLLNPHVVDIHITDNDGEFKVLTEMVMAIDSFHSVFIVSPVATIGFAHDNYMVTEGLDNSANLTVALKSGQLEREVVVEVDTSRPSFSATGMLLNAPMDIILYIYN